MLGDTSDHSKGRAHFVVDCQPLAEIVCGRAPITSNTFVPICERIVNNLRGIMQNRICFQKPAIPVEWRPRGFNQLADELANKAMDAGMDLEWESEVGVTWKEKDIIIFSDGGFRRKGTQSQLHQPDGFRKRGKRTPWTS